jgi:hypothetical protein
MLWTAGSGRVKGVGFFDGRPLPTPEPEPPRRPRPAWEKPEAALAGVAPFELLLARSAEAAIGLSGFRVYPSGFELTLTVLLRAEDRRGRIFRRLTDPSHDEPIGDEFLRFGLSFADGTSATNLGGRGAFRHDAEPAAPALRQNGGGGGGRRYDLRYWVWPLPPPGPVTFVAEWPARGIPESRAEVDAQPILDAATRAIQVFPED